MEGLLSTGPTLSSLHVKSSQLFWWEQQEEDQRIVSVVLNKIVALLPVTNGCLQGAGSIDQFFPPQAWRGAEIACWSPSIPLITLTQPRLVRQGPARGRLPVGLSRLALFEIAAEFGQFLAGQLITTVHSQYCGLSVFIPITVEHFKRSIYKTNKNIICWPCLDKIRNTATAPSFTSYQTF